LRTAMGHLQRLHRARLLMEQANLPASEATKAMRPPVFYQRVGAFNRALGLWSCGNLQAALVALAEAERGCKRTGWPDGALCRNAILTLARRSAAMGRR
jgi:DNA polymerase III subunit delta